MGGRRALGLGAAVALLVIAAFTSHGLDVARQERVSGEARRLASDAGRRVRDAWSVQTESLAVLVGGAASSPLLLTALRGGVDGATLADIARTESWWAPYRAASAALSYDGTTLAFNQDAENAPEIQALVATVRLERPPGVRTALGAGGRALLMAAELAPFSRIGPPAVLVLHRRVEPGALEALAARTEAPVVLADDRGLLGAGGPPDDVRWLRTPLGYESGGSRASGIWAAVATPLAPHLWLWTGAHATEFARTLEAADARKTRVLWLLAALTAIAAVLVTWRRRQTAQLLPRAVMPAPIAESATTL